MMNKTDASRRHFLAGAAVSGIALSAGLAPVALAKGHTAGKKSHNTYKPLFFTDPEWRFIVAACDLLIPADEVGPGALDADVPLFIDRQMQTSYASGGLWYMQGPFLVETAPEFGYQYSFTPRDIYRIGIANINAYCEKTYGKTFAGLDKTRQIDVLRHLEDGSIELPDMPATVFFAQLLANTKEGFFADPVYGGNKNMAGWKMIGFPGARGDYGAFIKQHNKPYTKPPVSIEGRKE